MTIRKATISDIPKLLEYAKKFIEFYGDSLLSYNEEHLTKLGEFLINQHVLVVSLNTTEEVTGMLGAIVTPNVIDPSVITLAEMFWWVDEKYRNTRAGWELLSYLINEGRERNLPVVLSVLPQTGDITELLRKKGFTKKEESWIWQP